MAGGGFATAEGGHARDDYGGGGGVTVSVVVTCLMAASCGLIFGYDVGVSGARSVRCMSCVHDAWVSSVVTDRSLARGRGAS